MAPMSNDSNLQHSITGGDGCGSAGEGQHPSDPGSLETSPVQYSVRATPLSDPAASPAPAPATTTTDGSSHIRIRPLLPSDEPVLFAMWLDGWEDTLRQFVPGIWRKVTRWAQMAAAAIPVLAAVCCAARLPQHAAAATSVPQAGPSRDATGQPPLRQPAWFPLWLTSGLGPSWTAPALALHAVAGSLPGWVAALAAAAVLLAAAPLLVPLQLRLALLRFYLHRVVRRICPDMWDMYGSWMRLTAGREYWVAELLPEERLVGGVALKTGAAVRPLPPPAVDGCANGRAGTTVEVRRQVGAGDGVSTPPHRDGGAGGLPPWQPPEDAVGFTEADIKGHGPLEERDALVYRMVTDKAVRRRGVGRRLMEAVLARAAATGVARVLLATANADAASFYRACGFETRPGPVGYGGGGNVLWRSVGGREATDDGLPALSEGEPTGSLKVKAA